MNKKRRYYVERPGKDGWSRWVTPVMRKYLLVCCDCNLVHEFQFEALKVNKNMSGNRFKATRLDLRKYRVGFRCKRRSGLTRDARK